MKHISAVLMAGILIPAVTLAAEHAKDLSKKEIHHLIQTASTPAEHNQLAQHYRLQADKSSALGVIDPPLLSKSDPVGR